MEALTNLTRNKNKNWFTDVYLLFNIIISHKIVQI